MRTIIVSCLVLVLSASSAQGADEKADGISSRAVAIEPVVVSPTKRTQKQDAVPRSVDRIERATINEMQSANTPAIFEESQGVFVQRTNRGAGAPILRGFIGPQNVIVVDGVRFSTATFRTGPNQYLALLDAHAVKSGEALLGPSSVLYGNGAMGGVLYINYHEPFVSGEDELTLEGTVAGHFQSADLADGVSARIQGSYGDFGWLLGGSLTRFGQLRAGGGLMVPNSNYTAGYWQAKLLYSPSSDWSLSAGYAGMAMRDAGRTDKLGIGEVRLYDNDDHLTYLRYEREGDGILRNTRVTASFHQLDEVVDRYNCKRAPDGTVVDRAACEALELNSLQKRRLNDDRVWVWGGDASAHFSLLEDKLRLTTGVDFSRDEVRSTREDGVKLSTVLFDSEEWDFVPKARGNFSNGSRYTSLGAYLHAEGQIFVDSDMQLLASGGTRFSNFSAFAPDVPSVGDVSYDYSGLVFSAGLQLLLSRDINLFLSFAQGFRAPNLQETTVLGNTGSKFEIPNPDLTPERANTLELGTKLKLADFKLAGTAFISFLTDAIDEESATWEGQSNVDGTRVVRRVNTAEGQSIGVELRGSYSLWRLNFSSTVTWMSSELTRADGTTTPSRRVPPLFGTTSVRYNHPERMAYVEAGVRWAGAQTELHPSDKKDLRICESSYHSGLLDPDCSGSQGWAALQLRGGMQLTGGLKAELAVNNLLDTYYKPHGSGMPSPGTDVRLTLRSVF